VDPEFWQELREQNALNRPTSDSKETVKGKPLAHSANQQQSGADKAYQADSYPTVPAELKALRQWVLWREEERDGKPTKIPYQVSGRKAQSNQSNTWIDYHAVCNHRDDYSGFGFVFSNQDPYTGIDLDDCIDNTGNLKTWAQPIVNTFKNVVYGEVSPSGNGLKFWTCATLPSTVTHRRSIEDGEIEIYDRGRYFTVTGHGKGEIKDGQAAVDWLVTEFLKHSPAPRSIPTAPSSSNLSTDQVIAQIRQSKQSAKFDALMQGNTTGYGSQSEADLALVGVIAFWTQENAVIDAVFRQSALMRAKWDERHRGDKATYGQMTIEAALSGNHETYKPQQNRKPYSPTRRRLNRTRQLYGDVR